MVISFDLIGWATSTRPATDTVAESRPQSPSRIPHLPTHEAAGGHLARPGSKIKVGTTYSQRSLHPLEANGRLGGVAKQGKQAPQSCSAQLLRQGNTGNMKCSHWDPKQWARKTSEHHLSISKIPLVLLRAGYMEKESGMK